MVQRNRFGYTGSYVDLITLIFIKEHQRQPQKSFLSGPWSGEPFFKSKPADGLTIFFCLSNCSSMLDMIPTPFAFLIISI